MLSRWRLWKMSRPVNEACDRMHTSKSTRCTIHHMPKIFFTLHVFISVKTSNLFRIIFCKHLSILKKVMTIWDFSQKHQLFKIFCKTPGGLLLYCCWKYLNSDICCRDVTGCSCKRLLWDTQIHFVSLGWYNGVYLNMMEEKNPKPLDNTVDIKC